ncbi:YcnI family protein [Micromonospora carbonacea subsp. aurantiaca]|uniref:YcnI family protein n=1 Tax=Micromonospora carbonacea TaxID=47853 RepID=A0A7H8XX91_9ACTN|nr:YcnI family protein [Micromonospora carbonacea]
MRTYERGLRLAASAAVAVVAATLGWAGTALAADVTSTPEQARQGDPVRLEIVVPEERPGARTERIELRLPAAAPVGEAYPMSVTGWAPLITTRKLAEPIPGIHGTTMDTVTASVVWTRAKGAPAGPARLAVSMGPLPQAEKMVFEVVQTYSDGTVVRWADPAGGARPAPVLTLLPAAAGGHGGDGAAGAHGGGPSDTTAAGEAPTPAVALSDGAAAGDRGMTDALLAAGLVAGLGGGAALGWLATRWRRRTDQAAATTPDGDDLRRILDGDLPPPDAGEPAGTVGGTTASDAPAGAMGGAAAGEPAGTADGTTASPAPAGAAGAVGAVVEPQPAGR